MGIFFLIIARITENFKIEGLKLYYPETIEWGGGSPYFKDYIQQKKQGNMSTCNRRRERIVKISKTHNIV